MNLYPDRVIRRLAINSGWLFSAKLIGMIAGVVQGILVARGLGPEGYGYLGLVTVYTNTIQQIVDFRVWETAIKFVIQYREEKDAEKARAVVKLCYFVDSATALLAFLILIFTAYLAARLFIKSISAGGLIQLYALSVLITVPTGTSSALLRVGNRFDWLAYQNVGGTLLRLCAVIVVISLKFGIKGLLVAYLATQFVSMVVIFILSHRVSHELGLTRWWKSSLGLLRDDLGPIMRFMFATNGNALFKLLQRNADTLLIGYFLGPIEVGYFRAARSLANLISFPADPLYVAIYPELSRLWHKRNFAQLRTLIYRFVIFSASIALLMYVLILFRGAWLIQITAGKQYLPAVPVLRWLALGVSIAVVTNFGHPLLLAMGKATRSLWAMIAGVIFQWVVLVLLLPKAGIVAAGVAYLSFYVVWATIAIGTIIILWRSMQNGAILG